MSYGVFAEYYDRLTQNVDYDAYARRLDEIISSGARKRRLLVDLGCGTGSLSLAMEKLGYNVTGIDLSCDMLSVAFNKKIDGGYNAMFVNQDITEFSLPFKADAIICSLDVLNHLPDRKAVIKVFKAVGRYLDKGGVFLFDMNTPYKHRELLSDRAFIYDLGDAVITWQNDYNEADRSVDIALDFFIENEDGSDERYSEEFSEQVYDQADVIGMLDKCSLSVVGCYEGYSHNGVKSDSDRILYEVIRKD